MSNHDDYLDAITYGHYMAAIRRRADERKKLGDTISDLKLSVAETRIETERLATLAKFQQADITHLGSIVSFCIALTILALCLAGFAAIRSFS